MGAQRKKKTANRAEKGKSNPGRGAKPRATAKPKRRGGRPEHIRSSATERIVTAMVKARARHPLISEALGISDKLLYEKYRDLIPEVGPGRRAHEPDEESRTMVANFKAGGLTHDEIAAKIGLERSAMEKHYATELLHGKAQVVGMVGNKLIVTALSNAPDAARSREFFLSTQGAEFGWGKNLDLSVSGTGRAKDSPEALVNGRVTRDDARRVAFLLAKAAIAPPDHTVVSSEPIAEATAAAPAAERGA